MNRPLKTPDNRFAWYRLFPGDVGITHDENEKLTEHWLPANVFDRLAGGHHLPLMGIRLYASERDAMNDFANAKK